MKQLKTSIGRHKKTTFRPDVKSLTRPVITGTKVMNGVKYYKGEGGKLYEAEPFDKMFTGQKMQIKPNNFRADVCKTRNGNKVID